ncbi:MAG: chromosomal replication initiator protein DnaA, partial [Heliobacteriaceae bacterium]|nr:chromosomal replication initiator protein DnaA [Heliobacteriaceae bacterium]
KCEDAKKAVTIDKVARAVGEFYGVAISDFLSASRSQRVSSARHVAVYLARELTGKSFENIAEYFNKKHTTMLYSYEKIKEDLKVNKELEDAVKEIKKCMTT